MKKIRDMGRTELTLFIIAMVIVFFIFGIIVGVIAMKDQAREDLIKTNVNAEVCYIRCPKDFQCFKTCFWAKTHDYKIIRKFLGNEKNEKYEDYMSNKIYSCVCPQPNLDPNFICNFCNEFHIMCVGHWEIINGKCSWVCQIGKDKLINS